MTLALAPKKHLLILQGNGLQNRNFWLDSASPLLLRADQLASHQGYACGDAELLDGYQAQYLRLPDNLFH